MDSVQTFHLLFLGIISFVVTFACVPLAKRLAFKLNAIDYPSARRVNTKPMPRMGGITMFMGVFAALVLEVVGEGLLDWMDLYRSSVELNVNYAGVMAGLAFVCLVGAIDDVRSLTPRTKLLGQIAGACVIVFSGVLLASIKNPFGPGFIEFGWLAYPITVFYLVGFMNVINLVDGLDGLAAGIVAIASGTLFVIAIDKFRPETAMFAIVLLGATLAFLRYNFAPASIFMGDSGSLFIGAMLGVISLLGVIRSPTVVVLAAPLIVAAIPIVDALVAILRRLKDHQPIQQADTKHLHHRLLRGFPMRTSVLIVYAWTLVLAGGAYCISNTSGMWVLAVFIALALVSFAILMALGILEPVLRHHYHGRTTTSHKDAGSGGAANDADGSGLNSADAKKDADDSPGKGDADVLREPADSNNPQGSGSGTEGA